MRFIQVDGGGETTKHQGLYERAQRSSSRVGIFGREDLPRAYRGCASARVNISKALEWRARRAAVRIPKPTVGAVVVRDGEIVGEGATEAGGRHAEVVALAAAGERARGATLYARLEPARTTARRRVHGRVLAAGSSASSSGRATRTRSAGGEYLRAAGVDVDFRRLVRGARAERGVAHVGDEAAAVRHLQGAVTSTAASRSPTGVDQREASLRLVHELRARSMRWRRRRDGADRAARSELETTPYGSGRARDGRFSADGGVPTSGSSAGPVDPRRPPPTATASTSARSSCTSRRLAPR